MIVRHPVYRSGFQKLVPLLPSLEPLYALLVHLLGQFLISLLLFLSSSLVFDALNPFLKQRC